MWRSLKACTRVASHYGFPLHFSQKWNKCQKSQQLALWNCKMYFVTEGIRHYSSPTLLENSLKIMYLMTTGKILFLLEDRIFVYNPVCYFKFQIQFLLSRDSLSEWILPVYPKKHKRGQPLVSVKHTCKLEKVIYCTGQIWLWLWTLKTKTCRI